MYQKLEINSLLSQLEGWTASKEKEAIFKKFTFANFEAAFLAMTEIAKKAEEMDHHPEWSNVYNRVDIYLTTHDAGGISELDFTLAGQINKLLQTKK